MSSLPLAEWRRLERFHPELALIAFGALALVATLCLCLYRMAAQLKTDDFLLTPYLRFAYASFFKPHQGDRAEGQQSALESFYAAQVVTSGAHLNPPHS